MQELDHFLTTQNCCNVFMFIEGTDNPMVAKYGPGGLNQPNAQSICPIHIAVENADKVSLSWFR